MPEKISAACQHKPDAGSSSTPRTIEYKSHQADEAHDEASDHMSRLPRVLTAATRQGHEEQEQAGSEKDDADIVNVLDFLPHRVASVEVGEIGWELECNPAYE